MHKQSLRSNDLKQSLNFNLKYKQRLKAGIAGLVIVLFFGWFAFFQTNFFPFLFQLVFNKGVDLKNTEGRINVLLLGTAGQSHEGPDLTDTIIFASIDPSKNDVTLVSIPRDLWIPQLSEKINTAYVKGRLPLAEKTVSRVLNQPVNYAVRLNFNGFVQAVDLIGGLDVNIERSFDDFEYPIEGKENDPCGLSDLQIASLSAKIASGSATEGKAFPCRYRHISFDKGIEHLDGKKALEFVRSRHAQGLEGTDFARSARQEKIIKAFKDKVFSLETVLNPAKFISLYSILKGNIDTDIKPTEMDDFVRLAQKMKLAKVKSAVIDYGDANNKRSGLLINPPLTSDYKFQWVLIPRIGNGNFEEIQGYIDCEITLGSCTTSTLP